MNAPLCETDAESRTIVQPPKAGFETPAAPSPCGRTAEVIAIRETRPRGSAVVQARAAYERQSSGSRSNDRRENWWKRTGHAREIPRDASGLRATRTRLSRSARLHLASPPPSPPVIFHHGAIFVYALCYLSNEEYRPDATIVRRSHALARTLHELISHQAARPSSRPRVRLLPHSTPASTNRLCLGRLYQGATHRGPRTR
jgi:hypothetical protein